MVFLIQLAIWLLVFNNKILLSWSKTSCGPNTTATLTLPTAYTTLAVPFLQEYGSASDNYFNEAIWITSKTKTSITWFNSNGSTRTAYVFIIGY